MIGTVTKTYQIRTEPQDRACSVIDWDAVFAVERYFGGEGKAEIVWTPPNIQVTAAS